MSPPAVDAITPAGPSAAQPAVVAPQHSFNLAAASGRVSVDPPTNANGAASSYAKPPLPAAGQNTELRFSTAASNDGLGNFQGQQFWSSKREYSQHIKEILSLNSTPTKLLKWIVNHDMHAENLSTEERRGKVGEALSYLLQNNADATYKPCGHHLRMPSDGRMDVDSILRQLDAEVKVVIQNRQPDPVAPQPSELRSLKDQALSRQVAAHTIVCQLFACSMVGILRGQRTSVSDACLDDPWLNYARGLAKTTEEALEARCFNNASVKQRFFYADVLKNAVAKEINDKAQQRDGAKANDLQFLLAMQEETQAAKQAMKDSHHTYEGIQIALDPHLEHMADALYDEILAQIKEALDDLHLRQSRRGSVATKRGAETVQDKDASTVKQPPPARKRGRPAASKNKPKGSEASQSTQVAGGQQAERQAVSQPKAQHPARVQELGNVAAQSQPLNAMDSKKPVSTEKQMRELSKPKSILKATSVSPTDAPLPLADSTLQSLPHQHSLEHVSTTDTHHVHFSGDVLGAKNGSSGSVHSMSEIPVYDEALVSGEDAPASGMSKGKGNKRAREEDEDVDAEQPSPKSPRLDLAIIATQDVSEVVEPTVPETSVRTSNARTSNTRTRNARDPRASTTEAAGSV